MLPVASGTWNTTQHQRQQQQQHRHQHQQQHSEAALAWALLSNCASHTYIHAR